mgnify:FL=1
MSAITDTALLEQPSDSRDRVWRYMDFAKFVNIAIFQSLYLPRSDMFEDLFEGTYSQATVDKFPKPSSTKADLMTAHYGALLVNLLEAQPKIRKQTFISCWHLSNHESAAMWKLYSASNQAIAIVSTYAKLAKSMPDGSYIGKVEYIDYGDTFIPTGSPLIPFFRKRKSFEHEKEIRVVVQNSCYVADKYGVTVPFQVSEIIDSIFIAPSAPGWYLSTVREFLTRLNLDIVVHQSGLDQKPLGY